MRLIAIAVLFFSVCGCTSKKPNPVPVLPSITAIKARLLDVPELSLKSSELIEVPKDQLELFAKLVVPTAPCQQIDSKENFHVANVTLEHGSGNTTTLTVRWTGHNPAAVSIDGKKYYYGSLDEFPDGATRIFRLLGEYDFKSGKAK